MYNEDVVGEGGIVKYLIILMLSSTCLADSQNDLINHIELRCDFFNEGIPLDIREGCMVDYINSAVVGAGEIDLKQASEERLKEAKQRREEHGEFQY